MWSHVTRTEGRCHFFAGPRDLVRHLQPRHRFLKQWTAEGGRVSLIVHLPGDINMGDDLEPETLQLMSELGIGLGVEVFPRFKPVCSNEKRRTRSVNCWYRERV